MAGEKRDHDFTSVDLLLHVHRARGRRAGGANFSRRKGRSDRGSRSHRVKIIIKCLDAWGLKRTVLVADGEPAIQALMTAVKLARQEETVVTGVSG